MSYIRSGSNPEGLYIWAGMNFVNIWMGEDQERTMPVELWEKLLETWTQNYYDDVALTMVIGGVKHEVTLTERFFTEQSILDTLAAANRGEEVAPARMKVCITYKNDRDEEEAWTLDDIWPVTMHYIAQRHDSPYYSAGWFKRQMLRLLGV